LNAIGQRLRTKRMPSADRLIEFLRAFQNRKGMYVEPVNVATVQGFLTGFATGCGACGFDIHRGMGCEVKKVRGWDWTAVGPIPQMQAKGLSDEEIMDELIEIEAAIMLMGDRSDGT
jgi:hypothetical protein